MTPPVSIVLPTYQPDAKALTDTLDSVLAQTETAWELIVVDDGSPLPFAGLNEQAPYAGDERIEWVPLERNGGVAKARNAAMQRARGNHIAFIDCGDIYAPTKLARQLARFASLPDEVGIVYCGVRYVDPDGTSTTRMPLHAGDLFRSLLIRVVVPGSPSSIMLRRAVYEAIGGFYVGPDIPEDREYLIRASRRFHADFVYEVLVDIERRPGSRSSDPAAKAVTYKRLLDSYEADIAELGVFHDTWAHYHLILARKHWRVGQRTAALGRMATAAVRHAPGFARLAWTRLRNDYASWRYRRASRAHAGSGDQR